MAWPWSLLDPLPISTDLSPSVIVGYQHPIAIGLFPLSHPNLPPWGFVAEVADQRCVRIVQGRHSLLENFPRLLLHLLPRPGEVAGGEDPPPVGRIGRMQDNTDSEADALR